MPWSKGLEDGNHYRGSCVQGLKQRVSTSDPWSESSFSPSFPEMLEFYCSYEDMSILATHATLACV